MKRLVKGLFYALTLVSFLVACSDDDDEKTPTYGEAKLLSFGFYAEDNAGVLLKDYVVEEVTSSAVNIQLPDEVNKTQLVARFTVTENDVVTVNGTTQVSGVTTNDFTKPVDYLVTEGSNNTRYTVTVGKLPDAVWSKLATFNNFKVTTVVMKVSPKTNEPYFVYLKDEATSADERLGCVKYASSGWEFIGANGVASTTRPNSYIDFAFNEAGNPYVVFGDHGAEVAQSASVVAYDGASWGYVGNSGITSGRANYNAIAMVNNQPIIFTVNNATGSAYRRQLFYNVYNGSSWSAEALIPNRPGADGTAYASYNTQTKVVNGIVYLAVLNVSKPGLFSIYTYHNGTWNTLYEGGDTPLDSEVTAPNVYDLAMDIDRDGNIYMVYAIGNTTAAYSPIVKKYTAATAKWSTIGGPIQVTNSNARYYDIAVSPYGVPFVFYRDDSKYPAVVALDEESQQWTAPLIIDPFEDDELYIDFSTDGVGYLSYRQADDGFTVWKYDVPQDK